MSLKKNISSNYVAQFYLIGLNYLTLPYLFSGIGAEGYGLIGFFATMQAWFSLLDLGMLPALSRESNKYHAGAITALEFRKTYRVLLVIFLFVGVVGSGLIFLNANVIAFHWIKSENIKKEDIIAVVQIMALCAGLRWFGGIYRSLFLGAERMLTLNSYSVFIATLRFVAVFGVMNLYGYTVEVYFFYQLIIALIELFGLILISRTVLPKLESKSERIGWEIKSTLPVIKFALTIAFTSTVWILLTQLDKLILSGILNIKEFGYLTIATMLSSSVNIAVAPLSTIIMSRLSKLQAEKKEIEFLEFYRKATRWVVLIVGTMAILLAFFSDSWIAAWIGAEKFSKEASIAISLYSIGNAIIAVGAFPYYMQYAKGELKYHLRGNLIFGVLIIPILIGATIHYGVVGAGMTWIIFNLTSLLFWQNYIHSKFIPKFHWNWIFSDIFLTLLPGVVVSTCIALLQINVLTKLDHVLKLGVSGALVLSAMIVFSSELRGDVSKYLLRNK